MLIRSSPCVGPCMRQSGVAQRTSPCLGLPHPRAAVTLAPVTICCAASAPDSLDSAQDQQVEAGPATRVPARSRRRTASRRSSSPVTRQPQQAEAAAQQVSGGSGEDELQAELAIQEEEASLSVEDLLQMQYEMPSDAQLDAEDADDVAALGDEDSGQPQAGKIGEQEDGPVTAGPSRKAAVLLEIIAAAAGTDLDAKIAQFVDEIDDELLALLDARISAIAKFNQSAAEQLQELAGVLRVVRSRAMASPALRLLDDVLDILGDDLADSPGYANRRLQALQRLREAFSGGASPGVDIFAAAAALAEAGPLAAAELAGESVDPGAFIAEVTGVRQEALEAQTQLAADLERAAREIAYLEKHKPEMLRGPQAAQFRAQLISAKQVHASRATTLSQLQDVLALARQAASSQPSELDEPF